MDKLSLEMKSRIAGFSGPVCRSLICLGNNSHSRVQETAIPMLLDVPDHMKDSIFADKSFASEEQLEKEFNSIFLYTSIIREKKFKCREYGECTGVVTARNLIDPLNTPPFLYVSDPTNFTEKENIRPNIYFPERIEIRNSSAAYTLHGRVYSSSNGDHFFTDVCYKIINTTKYLVLIDNLHNNIKVITSDVIKAGKILRRYPRTVYACYKKL
ncbi:hypothetical protein BD770DRAFT_243028 [Pilaira anomala]|nr:hypothetical protein BD770DRAFT_243028 [Pilaira anomala]